MTRRGADYERRKLDDYPTPAEVTWTLLLNVRLAPEICDPACGKDRKIMKAANKLGKRAYGSDIIYGKDFLTAKYSFTSNNVDIVTNPPYGDRRGSLALRFIERALELTEPNRRRVAMLLPIDFDSGRTRTHVFQHPAFAIKLVLLDRIKWFDGQAGSTNHAWYVWDWRHEGPAIIRYARIKHSIPRS